MKKKKEEMLIAKNVFKVSDFKTQKKSFNERFEKYINFVKISFNLPAFVCYTIITYKSGYTYL